MAILQLKKEKRKEGGKIARALLEQDAKQVILSPTDTHRSAHPRSSSKSSMASARGVKRLFDPLSSSTGSVDSRYCHWDNKQMYQSQATHNQFNHCIESQTDALFCGAQGRIPLYNDPTPQKIAGCGSGEGLPVIIGSDYPTKAIGVNSGTIKSPPEALFGKDETAKSYFDSSEDNTSANHRHALGQRALGIKNGTISWLEKTLGKGDKDERLPSK
ncbi:uncharacterized protein FMAN_14293 [Fusarium mangiferae]|uniref:Uncharacterized protein n=1 Tax=Fusarium mangiferae TaxID=192010 RepID=A0A1L7UMN1_FUSMA|nr:uncharacterized protein FMAN_14293 [Fusarium mangiferae]CVL09027.1 uncharacterized protein FMAN_14293 [Fusarium mangiferae]